MSKEDDDFWEERSYLRARLLSAVVGTGERDLEDGLSVSAQAEAHGGSTEDLRMLRVRLLNCIGDRHIAQQLRTAGTTAVCHDWDRPLRVSVQFWEHMVPGLLAVTNGIVLPEPPSDFLDRREKEVLKRHQEILALLRWKEEDLRSDAGETVWSEETIAVTMNPGVKRTNCTGRGRESPARRKRRCVQTQAARKGQVRGRISGSRLLDADRSGCIGCCHAALCG